MGFHVRLEKLSEDASGAEYRFTSFFVDGDQSGRLRFHKHRGDSEVLEQMPDDSKGHRFIRAAAKLRQHWKTGVLPDRTEWAS